MNLLVLLAYMSILTAMHGGGVLLTSIWPIFLHVCVNMITAAVYYSNNNRETANAFMLSALIVALVGFSSCWGLSSAAGGLRF